MKKELEKQRKLEKLQGLIPEELQNLPEEDQRKLLEATNSRSSFKSSLKGQNVERDDLEILLQEVNSGANTLSRRETKLGNALTKKDTKLSVFNSTKKSPMETRDDFERDMKAGLETNNSALNDTSNIQTNQA